MGIWTWEAKTSWSPLHKYHIDLLTNRSILPITIIGFVGWKFLHIKWRITHAPPEFHYPISKQNEKKKNGTTEPAYFYDFLILPGTIVLYILYTTYHILYKTTATTTTPWSQTSWGQSSLTNITPFKLISCQYYAKYNKNLSGVQHIF